MPKVPKREIQKEAKMNKTQQKQSWQMPIWKENREKFLIEHPFCEWHLKAGKKVKATTVHHPQKRGSISEADYISMKDAKAFCKSCHFAVRKGLRLCLICGSHYYRLRKGRDRCWLCFIQTPFGERVKEYYDKNPDKLKKQKIKVK